MKLLFGTLMLFTLAFAGHAQDFKVLAKIADASTKEVRGAPFSAEAVSESVQVLADGNKITRSVTIRMYRDGEGRFRREEMQKPIGIPGSSAELQQTIIILDPVAGVKFLLDPASKTARQIGYKSARFKKLEGIENKIKAINNKVKTIDNKIRTTEQRQMEDEQRRIENEKRRIENEKRKGSRKDGTEKRITDIRNEIAALEAEIRAIGAQAGNADQKNRITEANRQITALQDKIAAIQTKVETTVQTKIQAAMEAKSQGKMKAKMDSANVKIGSKLNAQKAEIESKMAARKNSQVKTDMNSILSDGPTKTESLSTRKIEGVDAEGTRSTKTIPAGAIGNQRDIDIVYERWYSKDLQLIILSKHSDPRFGEQTYRLTNIKRSEPDSSLFSLPADYTIVNERKPRVKPSPASQPRPDPIPEKKTP